MRLSVVVPFYNVDRKVFDRCLSGILAQTYTDFELIIVDDGSREECARWLDECEGTDPRIRVLHKANGGAASARNFGVEAAGGEYVIFADADDDTKPYFFQEAVELADRYGSDFLIGGNILERDAAAVRRAAEPKIHRIETKEDRNRLKAALVGDVRRFESGAGYYGRGPWCRIVRRECLKDIRFPEGLVMGEDIVWNLQLVDKCENICLAEQVWYIYYLYDNSVTKRFDLNSLDVATNELLAIGKQLDPREPVQMKAYYSRMISELIRLLKNYECSSRSVPSSDMKRAFSSLRSAAPWNELKNASARGYLTKKRKIVSALFNIGWLFPLVHLYWTVRNKRKRSGK